MLFLVQEGEQQFYYPLACGGGQREARQAAVSTGLGEPISLQCLPVGPEKPGSGAPSLSSGLGCWVVT